MPITPDYTWRETPEEIVVQVQLRGALARKPNVHITDAFIRITCPPHLLQLDLQHDVNSRDTQAQVTDCGVKVVLPKVRLDS